MSRLAVVLIRSPRRKTQSIFDTLDTMNIKRKNNCAVLESTPENLGRIKKVKDLVTWGEISEETAGLLEKKMKGKKIALNPPRKGYGRKGIKVPFKVGGGLGYRGDKINDLIKRMLE